MSPIRIAGRYKIYVALFLFLAIGTALYFMHARTGGQAQTQFAVVPSDKENLVVFLPTDKGGLERKTFEVKSSLPDRAKADLVFSELRKGKVVPGTAKLHQLAFGGDGVLYLDVSRDVISQQLDTREEIRIVYALVNSFIASFKDVSRVQLLVDGRPVHTFSGTVYTYAPLPSNDEVQEE